MISAPDRRRAVELIEEAVEAGASAKKACEQLQISHRSYQRWSRGGQVQADRRPEAERAAPANRLSEEERSRIIERGIQQPAAVADRARLGGPG